MSTIAKMLRGVAVVATLIVLSFVSPFIAYALHNVLPRLVVNLLFFLPQYVFPTAWGPSSAASPQGHTAWAFITWAVALVSFGWLTRHLRMRYVVPLGVLVFIALPVLFQLGIMLSPYTFELDGP